MTAPHVSVCIVAGRNTRHLNACLASLVEQEAAPAFEVLVANNSGQVAITDAVRQHLPSARVISTYGSTPGAARNPLIEAAHGELLLFLDDDIVAPPTLLSRLAALAAAHPEAVVFGGPNHTPPRSSRFQVVQGAVLGSVVGSGPVCRRYGPRHAGPADERWFTLCNLAVRREAMLAFPGDLVAAEENAVLSRLSRDGAQMQYSPDLVVFHDRRDTIDSFGRQMFWYGTGRGALMRRDPATARAAYFAPSALLAYLVALLCCLVLGVLVPLVLLPGALYGGLVLAQAAWVGRTMRRPGVAALAAGIIVVLHACYGAGVLRGLVAWRPMSVPAVLVAAEES